MKQTTILVLIICLTTSWATENLNKNSRNSKIHKLKNVPRNKGKPLPIPQSYISTDTQHNLDERNFKFQFVKGSFVCDVVTLAFYRYHKIIFRPTDLFHVKKIMKKETKLPGKSSQGLLKNVFVNIHTACEDYPSLESDESYVLEIAGDFASIDANSNWGALRGLLSTRKNFFN